MDKIYKKIKDFIKNFPPIIPYWRFFVIPLKYIEVLEFRVKIFLFWSFPNKKWGVGWITRVGKHFHGDYISLETGLKEIRLSAHRDEMFRILDEHITLTLEKVLEKRIEDYRKRQEELIMTEVDAVEKISEEEKKARNTPILSGCDGCGETFELEDLTLVDPDGNAKWFNDFVDDQMHKQKPDIDRMVLTGTRKLGFCSKCYLKYIPQDEESK